MKYDVLVVGAGPVGSHTARRLAETGCRVGILEKHPDAGNKSCCTGIIGRECFEVFGIDRGCVLREASSARLFAPSGDDIRVSRDDPQAFIVDRRAFDRSMAQRAAAAGADFLFSSEVMEIAVSDGGVDVHARRHGRLTNHRAKAVVIANGFGSKLPESLGLGRISNMITGAQAEVETTGIDEVEVYFSHRIAPGFFAWLVPVSDTRARVGLFAKEKPGQYLRDLLSQLVVQGKVVRSEASISHGGIPLKSLHRTFGERVLVAGDAAGQVKPTTGGGIYYGLISADFAAGTLAEACAANDFSARRLAGYEKLWKQKLGRELRIDYFARRLYNRLSDKRLNSLFNIVKDNDIHEALLSSSYRSFDWHGELVLDGLKRLGPWSHLFGRYLPRYVLRSVRPGP